MFGRVARPCLWIFRSQVALTTVFDVLALLELLTLHLCGVDAREFLTKKVWISSKLLNCLVRF